MYWAEPMFSNNYFILLHSCIKFLHKWTAILQERWLGCDLLGFDILLQHSGERYRPDLTVHPFVCHIIMLREPGFLPGNDN